MSQPNESPFSPSFKQAFHFVVFGRGDYKGEGGYVDHPADPGGATKYGITIGTLRNWRKTPVTKDDVKNLTLDEAMAIYKKNYWDAICGDRMAPALACAVFDAAVNSGVNRSIRWLQDAVDAPMDGFIGPRTLALAAKHDPKDLCHLVITTRLDFLRKLKNWGTFGKGWQHRIDALRNEIAAYPI